MPRPLRIEFPEACYHMIGGWNARLPIFQDDADLRKRISRIKSRLAKGKSEDPGLTP